MPVKVRATVEVNFRFPGIGFDEKTEDHRTAYNIAIETLNSRNHPAARSAAAVERATQSIIELAERRTPPERRGRWTRPHPEICA